MDNKTKYMEAIKSIALEPEKLIHQFLRELFSYLKESDLDDNEVFSLIHDVRVVFFQYMNDGEKDIFTDLIIKYLSSTGSLSPQMIEFVGVIYKYLPKCDQKKVLDCLIPIFSEISLTPRGIVAVTTFIKYTNKTYSTEEREVVKKFLENLAAINSGNYDLRDTISYAQDNFEKNYTSGGADVLFLIPEFLSGSSFLQPPLCFMRVAKKLEACGISSDILDNRIYNYDLDTLVNIIGQKYRYIIVTSTPIDQIQTYFVDHRFVVFAKTCKCIQKTCSFEKLIIVGAHGTIDYKMLLRDIQPDIIVRGEYDNILSDTILCCYSDALHLAPSGVIYQADGKWQLATGDICSDEWEDTAIDFSLIDLKDYFGYRYIKNTHVKQRNWSIMQASRGCPYECTFCYNLYGHKVRYKKIDVLIQELKQLYSLGCEEIFFIDQTFTINKDHVKEFCAAIEDAQISIPWQCETRVDLIDEELLRCMKRAGCKAVWLGIESFDDKVLLKCKKGYNLNQLKQAFEALHSAELEYHAFIMIGMEGESTETMEHTVETIEREKIKLSKSIIQCTPRVGTEYYMHLSKSIRNKIRHFWQIDALRGYSEGAFSSVAVNEMVRRLMLVANEV